MLTLTNCADNKTSGVDRANLDETVAPGADFYDYACGGWMKAHPLTAEYSRFGTFDELGEANRQQVLDLITNLDRTSSPNAQKIADLYALGMDSVKLNEQKAAPLQADLKTIQSLDKVSMFPVLATLPVWVVSLAQVLKPTCSTPTSTPCTSCKVASVLATATTIS